MVVEEHAGSLELVERASVQKRIEQSTSRNLLPAVPLLVAALVVMAALLWLDAGSSTSRWGEQLFLRASGTPACASGAQAAAAAATTSAVPQAAPIEYTPFPPEKLHRATWSSLSGFLQTCDFLAPLPDDMPQQLVALDPGHGLVGPVLWQGQGYPASIGELLGWEGGEAVGMPAVPPALPGTVARNEARVLAALHELTIRSGEGRGETQQPLHCYVCPEGAEQVACRSRGRAGVPEPRIGIIVVSRSSTRYLQLGVVNKIVYAQRHGYGIYVGLPADGSRHASWSRVPADLSQLPLYDWLWVVDSDTIVMNSSIPVTHFIDEAYDAVVTKDNNGLNTGSMLLRNSQWAEALLAEVYTRPFAAPAVWREQAAIIDVLQRLPAAAARVKVVGTKGLNSFGCNSAGDPWQPGDFLVHFPGLPKVQREACFMQFWAKLPQDEQAAAETLLPPAEAPAASPHPAL